MDAISFQLKMIDQMSRPAAKIAAALSPLLPLLRELEKIKIPDLSGLNNLSKIKIPKGPKGPVPAGPNGTAEMQGVSDKAAAKMLAHAEKVAAKEAALQEKKIAKDRSAAEKQAAVISKQVARDAAVQDRKIAKEAQAAAKLQRKGPSNPVGPMPTLPIANLKLSEQEVDKLKNKLRDAKLAVTNMSASMRQLKDSNQADAGVMALLQIQLQKKKNELGKIQEKLVLSGQAARFGSEGTNRLTTTLRELAEAAGGRGIIDLAKKIQGAGGQIQALTGLSSGASTAVAGLGVATVGTVAAIVALGAALAVATVAMGALILKGASLAVSASGTKTQVLGMFEALHGSAKAAHTIYTDIENVSRDYATTPDVVGGIAKELGVAGMRNTQMLRQSLTMITQAETVVAGAGGKLQDIVQQAAKSRWQRFTINREMLSGSGIKIEDFYKEVALKTGKSMDRVALEIQSGFGMKAAAGVEILANVVEKKFGGAARQQALKFDVQMSKLKANVTRLFDGVNLAPFLEGLQTIVRLFDSTTVTGAALKQIITAFYDGLMKVAGEAVPYIRTALKGMAIIALEIYIGLKPLLASLGLIGPTAESNSKGIESFQDATIAVGKQIGMVTGMIVSLIEKVGGLGTVFNVITGPTRALGYLLATGIKFGLDVIKFFAEADAPKIGGQIVMGLINGVKSMLGAFGDVMGNMATAGLNKFKAIFKIASPSRVMDQMGGNISLGLANGIRRMGPAANDNMATVLGDVGVEAGATGGVALKSGGQGGMSGKGPIQITVEVSQGAIVIQMGSGGNAKEIEEQLAGLLPTLLAEALEQAAAMAGLKATG